MGHWKGKLNDDEMTDAMPALNSPGTRAVADIEAELERVAQLRSGLPTTVQPGQYASALEAHLSSVSKALQLELEQTLLQAPGTTGTRRRVSPPCRPPPAGVALAAPHRSAGGRLDTRLPPRQLPSLRSPTPIPPASPRGAHPTAAGYGPASGIARFYSRVHACEAGSRLECLDRDFQLVLAEHDLAEYAALRMAAQPLQPLRFRQAARGGLDPQSCPSCKTC